MNPILKWAGGKRQLLGELECRLPSKFNKYCEPFIGGGALFLHTLPARAIINDLNSELINVYKVVKSQPEKLVDDLRKHQNTKEYFYRIREVDRNPKQFSELDEVSKASRIIYLNKTCYNGLYRVNSQGQLNAPFGNYKNPNIVNEDAIFKLSNYLNKMFIQIMCGDYKETLDYLDEGDFVYLDPPYDTDAVNFTGYTSSGFNRRSQKELKEFCDKLSKFNIKFMLSNSNTNYINDLYSEYNIEVVTAKRYINSKSTGRGNVEEVIIRNYE